MAILTPSLSFQGASETKTDFLWKLDAVVL